MPTIITRGAASAKAFGFTGNTGPTILPGYNADLDTMTLVRQYNTGVSSMLGLTFKRDGTSFYTSNFSNGNVYQYNLSTAWNISTASLYDAVNLGRGGLSDLWFNDTGTIMFVWDRSTENVLLKYTLSTPWNITSLSFNSESNLTNTNPDGLRVSNDGLTFMISNQTGDIPMYSWTSTVANQITALTQLTPPLNMRIVTGNWLSSVLGMTLDNSGQYIYAPQFNDSRRISKIRLNVPWRANLGGVLLQNSLLPSGPAYGSPDQVYLAESANFMYIIDYGNTGTLYQFAVTNLGP
jgi:hypothetical protein